MLPWLYKCYFLAEPHSTTLRNLQRGPCLARLTLEGFVLTLLHGRGIQRVREAPFSDLTLYPENSEFPAQITGKLLPSSIQTPSLCVLLKVDDTTWVRTHGASVCERVVRACGWVSCRMATKLLRMWDRPWGWKGRRWAFSLGQWLAFLPCQVLCGTQVYEDFKFNPGLPGNLPRWRIDVFYLILF